MLEAYARHELPDDLFGRTEAEKRLDIMRQIIRDQVPPVALRDPKHAWWSDRKVTDEFLDPVFRAYFEQLKLPNLLLKRDYHQLAALVQPDDVDPEVCEKLDAIVEVAQRARPTSA